MYPPNPGGALESSHTNPPPPPAPFWLSPSSSLAQSVSSMLVQVYQLTASALSPPAPGAQSDAGPAASYQPDASATLHPGPLGLVYTGIEFEDSGE